MAKVAFIMDDLFEDIEFQVPYQRVKEAGHQPTLVGISPGRVLKGKQGEVEISVDMGSRDVSASEFDALVIPGGYSPDKIRTDDAMVRLTKDMHDQGKPVAAICHGPWMLAEADLLRGRTVTSWPSLRTDLVNAGARWVDREVVEDAGLITSRNPDDLDVFSKTVLSKLD